MIDQFTQLNLHPQLVQAVSELGYTEPTPIQAAVIPLMLSGRDVIGQAQTGTGKTAAFALPLLQKLVPHSPQVQGLILTPTRELALQVSQALVGYGAYRDVQVLPVYGGQPYGRQIYRLKKGVDVVVGTPGRMLDLIKQKALDLSGVHTLVLDEADEMLSMGFIEDIEAILQETPAGRQTALFSATLPGPIRQLANKYMREPQAVTIERQQLTVAAIEQRYYLVNDRDKLAALTRLFETENLTSALIFARTRVGTAALASELAVRGFPAEALHGDMSQEAREQVLGRFRRNQIKVLVATDVAARGLDIDNISHVFNFDLPYDPEAYVHRIGRTGRAGKTGIAITLLTPGEQGRLRRIEGYTRQKITPATLPTEADIQASRDAGLRERMLIWLRRGRYSREQAMVQALVEEGHDLAEIAAAALKLARAEEKQRPIEPLSEVRSDAFAPAGKRERRPRHPVDPAPKPVPNRSNAREKGMVRLSISAGKAHGVRPNDIVGSIAYHANIPGRVIGAIRIKENHTLVDVPEEFVAQVLAKTGQYQLRRQTVTVERA